MFKHKKQMVYLLIIISIIQGCAAAIPDKSPAPDLNLQLSRNAVASCHEAGGVIIQAWERNNSSAGGKNLLVKLKSHFPSHAVEQLAWWDDNGGRVWVIWCVKESYFSSAQS